MEPGWYQTAVPELVSRRRRFPSWRDCSSIARQTVVLSSSTAESLGSSAPTRRGRPTWRGLRGGAGSNSLASSRSRLIMQILPSSARHSSIAA
jgi:hypothetical protein